MNKVKYEILRSDNILDESLCCAAVYLLGAYISMTSALILSPHSSICPLAHVGLIESRRTKTKECLSASYQLSVSPVSGDPLPPLII